MRGHAAIDARDADVLAMDPDGEGVAAPMAGLTLTSKITIYSWST
ncbi:hypothetical protein ACH4E5_38095 [Streptomyces afghaniensis]